MVVCISARRLTIVCPLSADVQSDIDVLYSTSLSWGLQMNPKKCAVLRFSRPYSDLAPAEYLMNGDAIPSVKLHLDLGVLVDTDLKFHDHIRSAVHKAGGTGSKFPRTPSVESQILCCFCSPLISGQSLSIARAYGTPGICICICI